ncbi:TetR/AcrR family transcriptional regulator [Amycolatopsis alba]|uniref:TetR family transcriptional regulator n=1 Tax=Amycolatopsis alba DSM 44262 TaxID=1125972 RepID=A0A229RUX6_AMYAL|nr:TetR family transcriptional regulator [Amycolatopsis alba]OXM50487.1 TetR family transcriptional regulator [Amycolatopsis alba DSM 44262]
MERSDRRGLIAEAATEILAAQGIRGLTHSAVDVRLDLPRGSTSYYFRTRQALLEAVVRRIADTSAHRFQLTGLALAAVAGHTAAANAMAAWLDDLLVGRRHHVTARYALTIELAGFPELHALLARALFSREHATRLCEALGASDPGAASADLVSLIEGLLFDRFAGARSLDGVEAGTPASVGQFARPLEAYLRGMS